MTKHEFETEISAKVLPVAEAVVSDRDWEEIALVCTNTELDEVAVAKCYWGYAGTWTALITAVRAAVEAKVKAEEAAAEAAIAYYEAEKAANGVKVAESNVRLRCA